MDWIGWLALCHRRNSGWQLSNAVQQARYIQVWLLGHEVGQFKAQIEE
jgi:hypothetical protein